MARINLLPWRENLKRERQKRFIMLSALIGIVAVGAIIGVHMEIENQINNQENRNKFLSQQISIVDKEIETIKTLEIEKTRLLNRMNVIQQLQTSRPEIVHLFEELVKSTPDGAQILKVSQKGKNISIEGIAESNSRISTFMRNLDKSDWLTEPELIVINANTREYPDSSWFSLKVKRSHPGSEKK